MLWLTAGLSILLILTPSQISGQQTEADQAFVRGKDLIERNCGDCYRATQAGLEEGLREMLNAIQAGYRDRVGALHLVAEASLARQGELAGAPTRFTAEISRGQDFEREFGPELVFRLSASKDPQAPGWTIEVRPKGVNDPEVEFSWVTTPPYRFFNPRYLEVSYGYSARQLVEMNPREFSFVRERADYDRGSEAVRKLLWPYTFAQEELDLADKTLAGLVTCRGSLRILDSRISAAGPDQPESIEWLKFEAELCP